VQTIGHTPMNSLECGIGALPPPSINNLVSKEVRLPLQEAFVSGGLPRFIEKWKLVTTDPVTLDAVSGLTIPFSSLPPCRLPTPEELSREDEDPVVDASVAEILALGAAVVVPNNTVGFYSRVFTVPKTERGVEYGKRFIINLKVSFYKMIHKVSFDFIQTCITRVKEFLHILMPTLNPVGDTTGYTSLIVQPLVLSNIPLFSL
jgi:hypothetical protein